MNRRVDRALTRGSRIGHNASVRPRTQVAAGLLLATLTLAPELAWAGVHSLQRHHHLAPAGHDHADPAVDLALSLVHGHRHRDGTPEHVHHLLPSAPARPEPVRSLDVARGAARPVPAAPGLLPAGAAHLPLATPVVRAGPPLLHLLGALLI